MQLRIPDDLLEATGLSERDLRMELALALYSRGKLSLGKAAEVAEIHIADLMREMADREIPLNYCIADFEHDIRTLAKM
jgi:predicted HTH domain antitoxin